MDSRAMRDAFLLEEVWWFTLHTEIGGGNNSLFISVLYVLQYISICLRLVSDDAKLQKKERRTKQTRLFFLSSAK